MSLFTHCCNVIDRVGCVPRFMTLPLEEQLKVVEKLIDMKEFMARYKADDWSALENKLRIIITADKKTQKVIPVIRYYEDKIRDKINIEINDVKILTEFVYYTLRSLDITYVRQKLVALLIRYAEFARQKFINEKVAAYKEPVTPAVPAPVSVRAPHVKEESDEEDDEEDDEETVKKTE